MGLIRFNQTGDIDQLQQNLVDRDDDQRWQVLPDEAASRYFVCPVQIEKIVWVKFFEMHKDDCGGREEENYQEADCKQHDASKNEKTTDTFHIFPKNVWGFSGSCHH